jgi:hypothetical protein
MLNKIVIVFAYFCFVFQVSCAPLAPSVPKEYLCDIDQKNAYEALTIGVRTYEVQAAMNISRVEETDTNGDLIQTYLGRCNNFVFVFNGDSMTQKSILHKQSLNSR